MRTFVHVSALAITCLLGACKAQPGEPAVTAAPESKVQPVIDACLVGTWKETRYDSYVDLTRFGGAAAKISGPGRTLTFEADGTETVDYGSGVTVSGTSDTGVAVETVSKGTVVFRVASANGTLSFTPVSDQVSTVYRSGGKIVATSPFGAPDPVSYTCSGDRMTQSSPPHYRAEYERARAAS